jgi:peptide chain release factor 1
MINKLEILEKNYQELTKKLSDPKIISNKPELTKYAKAHAELEGIVLKFRKYKKIKQEIEKTKPLLKDKNIEEELKELATEELRNLGKDLVKLEKELKILLISPDPHEKKNVIMEIRAGTGGEEAALFAADLFRMYARYAERKGWKIEILNSNLTGLRGFKEIIFAVEGKGAY